MHDSRIIIPDLRNNCTPTRIRLYALQSSGRFGQQIQRSNDGTRRESRWGTNACTTASPARISGTTPGICR
jgi:hypothetical protein